MGSCCSNNQKVNVSNPSKASEVQQEQHQRVIEDDQESITSQKARDNKKIEYDQLQTLKKDYSRDENSALFSKAGNYNNKNINLSDKKGVIKNQQMVGEEDEFLFSSKINTQSQQKVIQKINNHENIQNQTNNNRNSQQKGKERYEDCFQIQQDSQVENGKPPLKPSNKSQIMPIRDVVQQSLPRVHQDSNLESSFLKVDQIAMSSFNNNTPQSYQILSKNNSLFQSGNNKENQQLNKSGSNQAFLHNSLKQGSLVVQEEQQYEIQPIQGIDEQSEMGLSQASIVKNDPKVSQINNNNEKFQQDGGFDSPSPKNKHANLQSLNDSGEFSVFGKTGNNFRQTNKSQFNLENKENNNNDNEQEFNGNIADILNFNNQDIQDQYDDNEEEGIPIIIQDTNNNNNSVGQSENEQFNIKVENSDNNKQTDQTIEQLGIKVDNQDDDNNKGADAENMLANEPSNIEIPLEKQEGDDTQVPQLQQTKQNGQQDQEKVVKSQQSDSVQQRLADNIESQSVKQDEKKGLQQENQDTVDETQIELVKDIMQSKDSQKNNDELQTDQQYVETNYKSTDYQQVSNYNDKNMVLQKSNSSISQKVEVE